MEKQIYHEIMQFFEEEIESNPKHADLYFRLSLFQTYLEDYAKAIKSLDSSLKINPSYQKAQELKNYLQKILTGEKKLADLLQSSLKGFFADLQNIVSEYIAKQGDYNLSEKYLLKGFLLSGNKASYFYNLGLLCDQRGRTSNAIIYLKKSIRLNPRAWRPYVILSQIYAIKNKPRDSEKLLRKRANLKPDYADIRYQFGVLLLSRGKYKEAVIQLKKAITINPEFIFAHYQLGNALFQSKNYRGAEKEFEATLQLGFINGDIYLDLARAQMENGKYVDSIDTLTESLKVATEYTEQFELMAEILKRLGEKELSQSFRKGIKLLKQ